MPFLLASCLSGGLGLEGGQQFAGHPRPFLGSELQGLIEHLVDGRAHTSNTATSAPEDTCPRMGSRIWFTHAAFAIAATRSQVVACRLSRPFMRASQATRLGVVAVKVAHSG